MLPPKLYSLKDKQKGLSQHGEKKGKKKGGVISRAIAKIKNVTDKSSE